MYFHKGIIGYVGCLRDERRQPLMVWLRCLEFMKIGLAFLEKRPGGGVPIGCRRPIRSKVGTI